MTISWLAHHPRWGTIGLPRRAGLYVRQQDMARLTQRYGLLFRTKLDMAAELVTGVAEWLRFTGKRLWVVADGAYAKRPFLKAARAVGVVVVRRLRKDAALCSVPIAPRGPRRRGRPRIYGDRAIRLAKRAGHKRGWHEEEVALYGGSP